MKGLFRSAVVMAGLVAGLAVPTVASAQSSPVEVPKVDVSAQAAWDCPSGDYCVWENTGGLGRRCNWTDADPDWWAGYVKCSWARDVNVESAFDNGNSSQFLSVQVSEGAYDMYVFACHRRGTKYNITNGGVRLRSHKWVTYTC